MAPQVLASGEFDEIAPRRVRVWRLLVPSSRPSFTRKKFASQPQCIVSAIPSQNFPIILRYASCQKRTWRSPDPQSQQRNEFGNILIVPFARKVCFVVSALSRDKTGGYSLGNYPRARDRESDAVLAVFPYLPMASFGEPSILAPVKLQPFVELPEEFGVSPIYAKTGHVCRASEHQSIVKRSSFSPCFHYAFYAASAISAARSRSAWRLTVSRIVIGGD